MEKKLFNTAENYPKDLYFEHLLEQYKIYVETAEKVSERRGNVNKFYQTIVTSIAGLIGLIKTNTLNNSYVFIIILCLSSIILCIYWIYLLENYRKLNSAKFKVIHEIEKKMPLKLFDFEWTCLGRGDNKKKYKKLSNMEKNVPYLFLILFVGLLIFEFYKH